MTAQVYAYSADPDDISLTLKWECLPCCMEGGWSADTRESFYRLKAVAKAHNKENHSGCAATAA